MYDLPVQQGVAKALLGKFKQPYNMRDDEWSELDERALSGIRLCLADDVLFNIVSEKTAAESIEVKFKSEDKAITLLCSFPESWDHFVTSISLSSSETLEFDDVVASLLSEETTKRSNLETSTSEVMMVRGRSKERRFNRHNDSRSKSKGKKSKVNCWFCGKLGHLKKDCWKRQETSKEDSSKENKEANTTDTCSASGSGMSDEVLSVNLSNHDQHWLLDSGASNHMCIHREWFKTYKSINDGVVYMGNDVTCSIVGIGRIQLQMFDGTTKILTHFETSSDDSQDEHGSDASHEQVSDIDHEHVSDADHEEVPTDNNQQIVEVPETSLRSSTRMKRPPKRYDDYVTSVAFTANDDEPLCYKEAVEGSKIEKWKEAMKDKMMALDKNDTWDLAELRKDRKTVGCKWVSN
eukprot:PITA_05231